MGYRTDAFGRFDHPALAARHWVLSIEELRAAGLTDRQVFERERAGLLHRCYRGVYAVGRRQLSFDGECRAAVLACGAGSAICGITAARVHVLRQSTGRIHVAVPRGRRGHTALIVHRPRLLAADDVVQRNGYAVTSVGRTLLDMAPQTPVEVIGRWIHEAKVQRVFDGREVWAVLARHPHHRGVRRLEAALALEVAPTRSGLEDAFLPLVRAAGLPTPLVNSHQWSGESWDEVDFCWPALGLIVEADSDRYHSSRWRRRRDAAKAERFRGLGWTVWRVPELAITCDAAATAARLATLGLSNRRNASVR